MNSNQLGRYLFIANSQVITEAYFGNSVEASLYAKTLANLRGVAVDVNFVPWSQTIYPDVLNPTAHQSYGVGIGSTYIATYYLIAGMNVINVSSIQFMVPIVSLEVINQIRFDLLNSARQNPAYFLVNDVAIGQIVKT
jgi:hypothetical protein